MNEMPDTPIEVAPAAPKKNNTMMIVGIVAAVLICCCCILLPIIAWFTGDAVVQMLGL